MEALSWAILALPALLAVAARLAGSRAGLVGALGALAAAVPAVAVLVAAAGGERAEAAFLWLPAAGLELGLRVDGLSATISALVACVAVAVMIHARGYFIGSERAPQAVAALLAFIAAMQGLVLATNLLTLLIFWELVGALSARLIAYQRDDPQASPGAVRAFLTTRSADLGLYVAIAALFAGTGSVAFDAERPEALLGAFVGAGIVLAAAGKSAQLPFQTWLSGAMAGPTPVSALLHSATMVAAGVYLLVRAQDLLAGWPLEIAGWLGALTAVAAAAFALAQRDLKRVLASSTTSQLGLMFVAAGAGVPGAAVFHLVAHAAGKAGMFLAAGEFQRRRGGTSLERLAGVGVHDRATFWGFAIGAASIAAVPPLAAFWSKDALLKAAETQPAWFALAVVASVGTAAYLLRPALILLRPGSGREPDPPGRSWMLAGIGLLALATLTLGIVHTPLGELLGERVPSPGALSLAGSLAALLAGIGVIAFGSRLRPARAVVDLARTQLRTDAVIGALVQRPLLALAAACAAADAALDRAVDGVGRLTRRTAAVARAADGIVDGGVDPTGPGSVAAARGSDRFERHGVDHLVDGLAALVARAGAELPRLQGGQLYTYLRNTLLGIAVLLAVFAVTAIA